MHSPWQTTLIEVGLLVGVVVIVYVACLASRAIAEVHTDNVPGELTPFFTNQTHPT